MDPKTTELLLKTRKGATAAFGVAQWGTVLTECGFQFQTTKTGRTVTEVKITSPLDTVLTITKEPRYKAITFYKLNSWLKEIGVDLVEVASVRLHLDTPEVEKALKELYVRDLTNTGTCPVCEGNFKRNITGGMVHHGYLRPGDGAQHGDCFAVGYLPWELSAEGAEAYLEQAVRPHLGNAEHYLTRLQAGEITKFFKKERPAGGNYQTPKVVVVVTRESNELEFERMLASAVSDTERDIAWTLKEITRLEKKIAGWKLDVLPEVKHAGKFFTGR